ncbi:MAG: hydrogenase maturation nickel metallochaperone HypA [Flavobacteriaceae bacterium]|jgi:hydrogenase nickel incorporation protein HypA/HybF|nr:hydrogenase maturation nickel metallochaperone HypA [Flavobacteriaceae bacterium]
MHELSIATSILKTAEEEVAKVKGRSVSEIFLEIGKISGVEVSSLEFVWDMCMKNSVLERTELHICETGGLAKCAECGEGFKIEKMFDFCPKCHSPFKEILAGKEMKIKKMIIT